METKRGRLTVYLGAAPGVGKTYAMLGEARRRMERGTDVVVGYVETHERPHTLSALDGLEVLPRRLSDYRGGTFTELDVDAVLTRRPEVVCIDELAHTNVPGSRNVKRAEDIEELRRAGIDVITTVNIQHLESLNDEVERITGVRQRETVPDEVVRTADQINLVDLAPDALRRRMAHGNIYRPEKIDASLTSFFRLGNLTALRELALLWLADRVDDNLDEYRRQQGIRNPWPTKERIVVAVTGGAESETLLRRGARLAQRSAGSELLAVHVLTSDGLEAPETVGLARLQELTRSLDGTFHSVVGEDAAAAVVDFATGCNATMIIVGVSRHGRLRRVLAGTTGDRIAALAGAIDVHLVTHEQTARMARRRLALSTLSPRRQLLGWVMALGVPLVLAWWLDSIAVRADASDQLSLASLLLLATTVLVALVGGRWPAVLAAMVGFVNLNWWFTPPVGRITIAEPRNVVTLVVFVLVAIAVATVVDGASRRTEEAVRARAEAATLSALSRSVLTGQDTADAIVERVRESFGQRSVALLRRTPHGWDLLAGAGVDPADRPERGTTQVSVDDDHVMALIGEPLRASDQRVLAAFAVQTSLVLEYRRLREHADRAATLEKAEATSTALLRAVSHDLRTPLATMRTAVDGLRISGITESDRDVLAASAATSAAQLESLIDNLLDLSRVQAGLVHPVLRPASLEECVPLAIAGFGPDLVRNDVAEDVPLVMTDPGLLERVVANLVSNAVRYAAGRAPVRVLANVRREEVEILVADRGPGAPQAQRERMFEPFQRLDDSSPGGLGLGLAVARGLAEAIGGQLSAEDTPGGGLTMVIAVPRAGAR